MTTYLTKIVDGKTHHFRVTVENHVISVVDGVFYIWLSKYGQGCGDNASAIAMQKELVEEKIKEGYKITGFTKSLENSVDVYDKAKWHYDGDFPSDLDYFQGFVHTGMFLGWLIDNDLVSEEFVNNNQDEMRLFKLKQMTGSQVFEQSCDGVLMLDDINETGNRFALPYFDFDNGQYLKDYEACLSGDLPTQYHVPDTWDNYEKLKLVLNKRFSDWKNKADKKPFWKFW